MISVEQVLIAKMKSGHGCVTYAQIYIGEECDMTRNGGSIMGFCKSWRSLPIRSWSGGVKMADMPGAQPPRPVQSTLSALLAPEVSDEGLCSPVLHIFGQCLIGLFKAVDPGRNQFNAAMPCSPCSLRCSHLRCNTALQTSGPPMSLHGIA